MAGLTLVEHLWEELKHAVWRRFPSNLRLCLRGVGQKKYLSTGFGSLNEDKIAVIVSKGCTMTII